MIAVVHEQNREDKRLVLMSLHIEDDATASKNDLSACEPSNSTSVRTSHSLETPEQTAKL